MNNDLEFFDSNKIDNNLKCIFLTIIRQEIPSTKKNALKYLDDLLKEFENVTDVYGFISNRICKEMVDELNNDLAKIKYNSKFDIKKIIDDKIETIEKELDKNVLIKFEYEDIDNKELDEEIERLQNKKKQKLDKDFLDILKNNPSNDFTYFKKLNSTQKNKYLKKINDFNDNTNDKPLIIKLADLNTSIKNKKIIFDKIKNYNSDIHTNGENSKLKNWIRDSLKIPFGNYIDITKDLKTKKKINEKLNNISNILDTTIYGHEQAKNKLLQYLAELTSNKKDISNIITLQGPPGIGKTALIQNGLSKAFDLPFNFVSLGGSTDSSYFEGFDYTYEGSTYGKIVDIIIRSKCMNPIIYFDELDKVSETPKGQEIINFLTHITDSIQNDHFNDKYFSGIDIDLSKVIFIFSCNDLNKINKILLDRMHVIKLHSFSNIDKITISNKFIIPELLNKFKFNNKVIFDDNILELIINSYTYEGGIRKLKEKIYDILREINLRNITNKKLLNKKIKFPIKITKEILENDIFKNKIKIKYDKINKFCKVGIINGLWATDYGIGGIAPIEVSFSLNNNLLDLELTGCQGEVMQESMRVAKTVSLNLINKDELNNIIDNLSKNKLNGLHIHVPDGATPIDGPSAGSAITIAIYSLLTNKKIKNNIAITGEITLQGKITEIGGLKEKIYGGLQAGVDTILYPVDNEKDLINILKDDDELKNKLNFIKVDNIKEALKYVL